MSKITNLAEYIESLRQPKFTKIELKYDDNGWSYACSGINRTAVGSYWPHLADAIEAMLVAVIETDPELIEGDNE